MICKAMLYRYERLSVLISATLGNKILYCAEKGQRRDATPNCWNNFRRVTSQAEPVGVEAIAQVV